MIMHRRADIRINMRSNMNTIHSMYPALLLSNILMKIGAMHQPRNDQAQNTRIMMNQAPVGRLVQASRIQLIKRAPAVPGQVAEQKDPLEARYRGLQGHGQTVE